MTIPYKKLWFGLLYVSLTVLLMLNCERVKTPLSGENTRPEVHLLAEDISVTEVRLELSVSNLTGEKSVHILRDSLIIHTGELEKNDTTLYDENLLPAHEYDYVAQILKDSAVICSSQKIQITTPDTSWLSLGFEDKFALRMELERPYLYVCAGSNGLWRKNIRLTGSSLGNYFTAGVLDLDVIGNDILIAYHPVHVQPWTMVGIWRSTDAAENWFKSDYGIADSSWPYSAFSNVERSPHDKNIALARDGLATFRSTDGGTHWVLVNGFRGAPGNLDYLE